MKSRMIFVACISMILALFLTASASDQTSRLIIKLKDAQSTTATASYQVLVDDLAQKQVIASESRLFRRQTRSTGVSMSSVKGFPFDRYRIVSLSDPDELNSVLQQINALDEVEFVEPDYPIELFNAPDDPHLVNQWGIRNVGQQYLGINRIDGPYNDELVMKRGVDGADIRVTSSWEDIGPRARPLIVIIDTGLDTEHPDIVDNLWSNPGEIPGNGIDDDHNGYVDDIHGWDFSGDSPAVGQIIIGDANVRDSVGHGTHCAGIVGATSNNGIGVAGVCDNALVAGLKIFPNALMSVAAEAVVYAADIDADAINLSWGSPYRSTILLEALEYARSRGVLPIAASGNFGSDMVVFPASFDVVMTVGASNSDDEVTFFSSFGDWLDVVAPGRDVLSLRAQGTDLYAEQFEPELRIIDNYYYLADGTSMAAPHVCGAVGVLLSYSPGLTPDELQQIIQESADDYIHPYGDLDSTFVGWDRYSGHGRINVEAALDRLNGRMAKIVFPYSGEIVTTDMQVVGYAQSSSGETYSLDISESSDLENWTNIASGFADVSNDYLGTLIPEDLTGSYTLRLTVGDEAIVYRRVILAPSDLLEIDSPSDEETVSWFLTVRGSVLGPDFESYSVFLRPDQPFSSWDEIYSSTETVADSILCEKSLGQYRSGDYLLRVTMYTPGGEYNTEVNLTIEDKLIGSYPQSAPLDGNVHFAPTVADLNGDGTSEVIVTSRRGVSVFRSDGTPFCCGWPNLFGVDCYGSPAAYDTDGDGLMEVGFCGEQGLNLFDAWGARVDSFPKIKPTGSMAGSYPTTLMADIDNDSQHEILWIAEDGNVYAYRSNGMSYFASLDGWFADTHAGYFFGAIVPFLFSVDLEGDGEIEVIGSYASIKHGGSVYVWQARNGQPRPGHSSPSIASLGKLRGGCIADFNRDGIYDIAVVGRTATDTVFAAIMDGHGNYLPGWPKIFSDRWNYLVNYPAAGDVDGDSYPDLVFSISSLDNGEVYVLKYDGTPYRPNLAEDGSWFAAVDGALGCAVLGDVSGDGEVDVLVRAGSVFPGVSYERVLAFDRDGILLSGWPIFTFASPTAVTSTIHTPVLTDVDSDGSLDMVLSSDDGQVYVWNLETPYEPDNIPWGQYLHDSRNSGILPKVDFPTSADDAEDAPVPRSFTLSQNYPNPFNGVTTIQFAVERTGRVSLDIFNILGQQVRSLADDEYQFGNHSVTWDGSDSQGEQVASGVYFYRLRVGEKVETRKMVKLE